MSNIKVGCSVWVWSDVGVVWCGLLITLSLIITIELLDDCGVSPAHFAAQGGHLDCLQVCMLLRVVSIALTVV